jgi:hypothetical protein
MPVKLSSDVVTVICEHLDTSYDRLHCILVCREWKVS